MPSRLSNHTSKRKRLTHTLPHLPAVFSTHASPSLHTAADSEVFERAVLQQGQNRRVRGWVGFNRRVFPKGSPWDNFGAQAKGYSIEYSSRTEIDGTCGGD